MESEYLKYMSAVDDTGLYALMDQYGNDVWSYAYAITRNREQAKDIAQEVFIKAHYKIHTFRGGSAFKTWLLAITRNIAINEMKSSYVRRVLLFESVKPKQTGQSAEDAYMREHSADELWNIIMKLSTKLREVIILDIEHELTIKEMAFLLELSEGTVKSRLFRARRQVEIKWRELEK